MSVGQVLASKNPKLPPACRIKTNLLHKKSLARFAGAMVWLNWKHRLEAAEAEFGLLTY